jgi:hypothetical protein
LALSVASRASLAAAFVSLKAALRQSNINLCPKQDKHALETAADLRSGEE